MTKNEFLSYLFENQLVEKWTSKTIITFPNDQREDLTQEIYLLLGEHLTQTLIDDLISQSQGFKNLTAYCRAFCMFSISKTGRTRRLSRYFRELNSKKTLELSKIKNVSDED